MLYVPSLSEVGVSGRHKRFLKNQNGVDKMIHFSQILSKSDDCGIFKIRFLEGNPFTEKRRRLEANSVGKQLACVENKNILDRRESITTITVISLCVSHYCL